GRVLDVACGAGRNALFLASLGLEVTGVDVSEQGLLLAKKAAEARGLSLTLVTADLDAFPIEGEWDAIVCFHFLDRKLYPRLPLALRHGGLLAVETFTREQLAFPESHPRREEFLLGPNELLETFRGLHVLSYEEGMLRQGDGSRAVLATLFAERRPVGGSH
ncbi:class I SAM-dependent methyltransferase, partial [bacterium]|nr:class I SAM-dependent methyltransferase [bacterium]